MRIIAAVIAASLVATGAFAQPPQQEGTDVDETTTAVEASPLTPTEGAKAVEAAVERAEAAPESATPASGAAPLTPLVLGPEVTEGTPVFIADANLQLGGPPSDSDVTYDTRILGAFRSRQGSQGPLDGRWHVQGSDGAVLYTLQLADPGAGESAIEGAWRKPDQKGASGFIDSVSREADDIVLSFREAEDGAPTEVRLHPAANGGYTGEALILGARTGIIANRAQGVETASMAVPAWTPPPPPKAKPVKKKKGKAVKSKAKSKAKAKPAPKRKRK